MGFHQAAFVLSGAALRKLTTFMNIVVARFVTLAASSVHRRQ